MLSINCKYHVIFLQPHQVSVFICNNNGVELDRKWQVINDKTPLQLSAYLSINTDAVYSLLIDHSDEECHVESLPKLGVKNKKHYLDRLRSKYFVDSDLSIIFQGQNNSERSAVVAGVSSNPLCEEALQLIKESRVILQSIHSPITLMSAKCIAKGAIEGACLNIFATDNGCYRLIASFNSNVILNRRIDIRDSIDVLPELKKNIEETRDYLMRMDTVGWVEPIVKVYSASAGANQYARAKPFEVSQSSFADISSLDDALSQSQAALPLAALAAASNRGYARNIHRRHYLKHKIKHAGIGLAISACFGVVSTAAIAAKLGQQYVALSEHHMQATQFADSAFADSGTDNNSPVEAVRQALVTAKLAELRATHSPITFMTELAAVLDPAVTIDAVSWEREDLLDRQSLQAILEQSDSAQELPVNLFYRATLSGVINERAGSALDTFEAFVSILRLKNAGSNVVVVEAPFAMTNSARTSTSDLTGDGAFVLEFISQREPQ